MERGVNMGRTERPIDFFISCSAADERWGAWLAWELETAGYRTMVQAWDFVPGTNFIDFMDRGIRDAAMVVAVLSERYLTSTYGKLEWQTALRSDPEGTGNKLLTVRVEDCPIEGLLATITYVDLVGITDAGQARARVLERIGQALAGRAKPSLQPHYPHRRPGAGDDAAVAESRLGGARRPRSRRVPINPPVYPPAAGPTEQSRTAVTVLHVAGPRFGLSLPGRPATPADLQEHIMVDLTLLTNDGVPRPDLLVVAGDLTASGSPREFEDALGFLTGLRVLAGLEPHRLIVVPGSGDVNHAASRAYFANCEADDIDAQAPYWPKWRQYARLFNELYHGLDEPVFDSEQPWTLFAVPDLQVVVAGLNSTIADSHRMVDHHGWLGEAQSTWFAQWLRPYQQSRWLRLGVMAHALGAQAHHDTDADAPRDRDVIRDRGTFNRLVAPMLNALLCGTPPARPPVEAALPVVRISQDGLGQLLRFGRDGMTRWVLGRDGSLKAGESTARTWYRADATFTAADTAEQGPVQRVPSVVDGSPQVAPREDGPGKGRDADGSEQAARLERIADPLALLLDRLHEACEARHERVTIRRIAGDLPHLFVTYREDGIVRQQRVAGHVGSPTAGDVDRFVRLVHATNPEIGSELVYDGARVPRTLHDEAARRGVRVLSFTEFQGLLDLREYVAGQTARLQTDRLYPPELYVRQRFRNLIGADQTVHDDLVLELLRQMSAREGRFILVLADFGRGKTFALRELARRLPTASPDLIPILVELRSLDKAHSVEGLVAAHLANHGEELIDLKAFRYMLRQGRIALLFDGYDELVARVSYDRAADHLEKLLHAAVDDAKIVVASRTQHFKTSSQVFTALGERVGLLPHRRVLGIEDFTTEQVRAFLTNHYRGDERAANLRYGQLEGIQDLLGLSRNPRMLSFIAHLDPDRLDAAASGRRTTTTAALYREIVGSWLDFENRRAGGVPGAPIGLGVERLWQAVTTLAMRLWERGESFLGLAELTDVAGTLVGMAEPQLTRQEAAHAVGVGSLLIRTDEGQFGFIHSSIVEWLVAHEIGRRLNDGDDPPTLHRRRLSQLTVDFLCELTQVERCKAWTAEVFADPAADEVARANAMRISARLRLPARADLRGASLRGEDLSHRDMVGVDLTGADLTDARLVGTNLRGATLRDANLAGARLDHTRLTEADLSGADLTSARLLRADLRGVSVAGSTWRRTALIDVTADSPLCRLPELQDAVVAPGSAVVPGLAPPAVGVSYGFKVGTIPSPAAYSPDGAILAVGSDNGGVLLCDATSGLPVRTLQGHRSRVYAVAYAGRLLVTGSADLTVRLWDAVHGDLREVLEGFHEWIWPMLVSPDGAMLVTGDGAGVMRVWDTVTGALRHEWSGHAAPVWTAAFGPRGDVLAVGDDSGVIRVWDVVTGALRYEVHGDQVAYRLAYSPDGAALATAGHGGQVWLRDAATGRPRVTLAGHREHVYALDFHPDGSLLATGDVRGGVRLWRPASGRTERVLARHTGAVYSVAFSPDGSTLASADSDGVVRLWDPVNGQARHELAAHRGSVWPVRFRPDGGQIVTTSNDGTVRLWDTATGQCLPRLRGHGRHVTSLSFRDDGSMLAACGHDGVVRLWDPRTGQRAAQLVGAADRLVSFCPGGPLLATASGHGGVHLWNVDTRTDERELNVETDHVWAETFSPDGDVLATANDDDTVRLWYRKTGRHIVTLAPHRGRVRSVAFSPDGATVATGCDDRAVRLWDAAAGGCRAVLKHHTDRVYAVAFSPDGMLLASASNDGTACIWDPRSGERLRVMSEHTGRLWSAAFSPRGDLLATGGDDLVIRLWDPSTARVRSVLTAHTQRVLSVAFSPDSTLLASASDDGTVRLWDVADPERARLRLTLVGLRDGWTALGPDGRYKLEGDAAGQFWHVIGTCRFEPGELDSYLPQVRRLPADAPF